LNTCGYRFSVADAKRIRYGLGAIKGVGEAAIESIIEAREAEQPYRDLFDLCRRNDLRKLNRRVLEALIKAGALDCLGASRRGLMTILESALQAAEQQARATALGQNDLFGGDAAQGNETTVDAAAWRRACTADEWSQPQLLNWEKETLGLYLSGHPIDRYRVELRGLGASPLVDLKPGRKRAAGLVVALRFTKSRRGRMAILTLDDNTARVETTVYNELLEKSLDKLAADRILVIDGDCAVDDFSGDPALNAQQIWSLDEARQRYARAVVIDVEQGSADKIVGSLQTALRAHGRGTCTVNIDYVTPDAKARVRLADEWKVSATEALLEQLRAQVGDNAVHIEY
jgi:DNA polymerase-3 subunit alpha